jgi:hypothetical protein
MNNETKNQIRSEIRFLRSQEIRDLVKDADIGCCHQDCEAIERRINKLNKKLTKDTECEEK